MRRETDPDAAWVATLAGTSLAAARRALREAAGEEPLFRHIARRHREGGRKGYVEIDAPLELYALTRLLRPKRVVEVGVSSGVSSAYLLAALQRNRGGSLVSIDLPSRPRKPRAGKPRPSTHSWTLPDGRSTGWAVPRRLRAGWTVLLGDKADELPRWQRTADRSTCSCTMSRTRTRPRSGSFAPSIRGWGGARWQSSITVRAAVSARRWPDGRRGAAPYRRVGQGSVSTDSGAGRRTVRPDGRVDRRCARSGRPQPPRSPPSPIGAPRAGRSRVPLPPPAPR